MACISIHKNDIKETYIATIGANLGQIQAAEIAHDLNVMFSDQGLRWYALVQVQEET